MLKLEHSKNAEPCCQVSWRVSMPPQWFGGWIWWSTLTAISVEASSVVPLEMADWSTGIGPSWWAKLVYKCLQYVFIVFNGGYKTINNSFWLCFGPVWNTRIHAVIQVSPRLRNVLIDEPSPLYWTYIRERIWCVSCDKTWQEMKTFVWPGGCVQIVEWATYLGGAMANIGPWFQVTMKYDEGLAWLASVYTVYTMCISQFPINGCQMLPMVSKGQSVYSILGPCHRRSQRNSWLFRFFAPTSNDWPYFPMRKVVKSMCFQSKIFWWYHGTLDVFVS